MARYQQDQYYLPHFDAFDLTTGPGRECAASGGQRVVTVLIYLNDVPEGERMPSTSLFAGHSPPDDGMQ